MLETDGAVRLRRYNSSTQENTGSMYTKFLPLFHTWLFYIFIYTHDYGNISGMKGTGQHRVSKNPI